MVNASIDTRIPVTLLSGFLGSGKTTLLEHVLQTQHGLRIAVVVNDMAETNIDAALISKHQVSQKEEKVVRLQNGCVCCTLRADLLEEIAKLAQDGQFDLILIESSGISEPQGVAESWTSEFADSLKDNGPEDDNTQLTPALLRLLEEGGLAKISRLDTLVTVIDAVNFYEYIESAEMLSERYGQDRVDEEDERNISELLVEQIEFSNVILLNKCDLVPASHLGRIRSLVNKLNPSAKLYDTVRCNIDPRELLNTGAFDFDKAATSSGWLQSLKEVKTPETIEYGVTSLVYRRRRPFHPRRLYELITECFVLIEDSYDPTYQALDAAQIDDEMQFDQADTASNSGDEDMEEIYEDEKLDIQCRLARKRASPLWKNLYRAKGFIWLATRPSQYGELSCAGAMLTIGHGAPWFCTMPEESWPFELPEAIADVRADFQGPYGDRRQEIVLIGERLDADSLTKALDGALVTDEEWQTVQSLMANDAQNPYEMEETLQAVFDDGFEAWLPPKSLVKEMQEKGMHHHHNGHAHVHI